NSIEVGFALDVDEDHFFIFAYEHDYNAEKTLVLNRLPHCVHKAIRYDINDPRSWDETGIYMENIASATLFINNYLIDQIESLNNSRLKLNPAIELFDNKLYQQLIYRLAKTHHNSKVIELRFKFLLKNFDVLDQLDKDDPIYETTFKRAINQLFNFLFGCEDVIENIGFFSDLTSKQLKLLAPKSDLVKSICFYLINEKRYSYFIEFCTRLNVKFENEEDVERIYKMVLNDPNLPMMEEELIDIYIILKSPPSKKLIEEFYSMYGFEMALKLLKVKPDFNDPDTMKPIIQLMENGLIHVCVRFQTITNQELDFKKLPVQQTYRQLLQKRSSKVARELYEWTSIPVDIDILININKRLDDEDRYSWGDFYREMVYAYKRRGDRESVKKIYSVFLKNKAIKLLYELVKKSKIKPEFNTGEVLKIYDELLNSLKIDEIKKLYSMTKIKPDFNDSLDKLETAYRKLVINRRELSKARWLYQTTKIPLSNDLLQQVYSNLIMQSKLGKISKIQKWSHIPISYQTIQKLYLKLFSLGRLKAARELYDTFKVEPKFDEEEMKSIYTKMLSRGYINAIKELYEWSQIEPKVDNEVLQDRYLYALKMNKITNAYNLYRFFHVRPEFDYKLIQNKYKELINEGKIELAQTLYKLCEVPPDYTHNKLNKYYRKLLTQNVYLAKKLYKWTNIMPSESVVQSAYKRLLKKEEFFDLKEIYKWTKVRPAISDKEAEDTYRNLLFKRDVYSFESAYNFLEVPLSEQLAQEAYKYYREHDYTYEIERLEEICKIKPDFPERTDLESYRFLPNFR
ncbi:MAG: hypothetical protein ACTSU2_03720, partial [Promethearchaeota archaeon]